MSSKTQIRQIQFTQALIDAARYATDDFNLFHDSDRWHRIYGNRFGGPIVLGFQLNQFVEGVFNQARTKGEDLERIREHHLGFSNYIVNFIGAAKVDAPVELVIKPGRFDAGTLSLSNRFLVKSDDKLVIRGVKRETQIPLVLMDPEIPSVEKLNSFEDRSFIDELGTFYKYKYMNISNAKTFLLGSGVDQLDYFDELTDTVIFPQIFPTAYLSCALLERYKKMGHDFEKAPMVYTSHQICVDRVLSRQVKSNDKLHILISPPTPLVKNSGLGSLPISQLLFEGLGLLADGKILFRAEIGLATLENIQQPMLAHNS
ncbi:MAG TPA: hypothetical protein DCZ03_02600 [Gammaproteobacteria bacterium]|nr:hypothetical protein [Gammaproteobacteria bacterium]